ncbi:myeloid-associated differentiation marker-like [Budorcas taxicolor]|uniref:myeloid-associated differentiation marker-like n=1 Tax=Budorcas taxicolor TaxID=37181 RepID=UPI002284E1FD|nr:myeloid-associated differentiation marker-like [Budorcas taxicolor]
MPTRAALPYWLYVRRVFWFLHVPQLFSTCVAFSLVADMGIWRGDVGNWSMYFWCICFIVTLFIAIVEVNDLQPRFPFYWYNFPVTFACYATLICLSASIIYSITYVQFLPDGPEWDRAITATAFSCVASVLYAIEMAGTWNFYKLKEIPCYMHTVPGLLNVLETFVAGVIFAFLSNTSLYLHQPALEWCVAVYSICFIPTAVTILLNLGKWENRLPIFFPIFQLVLTVLFVLLYISALVLWPLYQFSEEFGGQPQRSSDVSCMDDLMCAWDQRLAVAVLTAINLLVYVADLGYWAHKVSVEIEEQSRKP